MANTSPGATRLRMGATVLVAVAASGLMVLASSHAAFDNATPVTTATPSNPTGTPSSANTPGPIVTPSDPNP